MRSLLTSAVLVLCVPIFLCDGCSRQSEKPEPKNTQLQATPEDPTAALARQHNLPLLSEELQKSVGTNTLYSIDIQRVLAGNMRIVASGTLHDIVQSGERIQAVFRIDNMDLLFWEGTCVATLDCPTNFISRLRSEAVLPRCAVAFEVAGNHHKSKFSRIVLNEDAFAKPWSVIALDGKLIDFEKLY